MRRPCALADTIGGRDEVADSIVRQALILAGWLRREAQAVEKVLTSVRSSIRSEFNWNAENLERWQRNEPQFGELLSLPIVRLAASAIELSYEYTNLLTGARILTDIRPIFTDDGWKPTGKVQDEKEKSTTSFKSHISAKKNAMKKAASKSRGGEMPLFQEDGELEKLKAENELLKRELAMRDFKDEMGGDKKKATKSIESYRNHDAATVVAAYGGVDEALHGSMGLRQAKLGRGG